MMTVNFNLNDERRATKVFTCNQDKCGVVIIRLEGQHGAPHGEVALFVKDAIAAELIRDAIETALAKPETPKAENSNVIHLATAG